jgi:hypothetical protein
LLKNIRFLDVKHKKNSKYKKSQNISILAFSAPQVGLESTSSTGYD